MKASQVVAGNLMLAVFLLFLGLKLFGVIDWSWWWVTSPLWIGLAIALAVMVVGLGFVAVLAGVMFVVGAILDHFARKGR